MKMNLSSFVSLKKVIYTCIVGKYDDLKKIKFKNPDYDYICFTDNQELKSDDWEIRHIELWHNDPVRTNRRCKILPHEYLPEYDYSIYIDGSVNILNDVNIFLNSKDFPEFIVKKHSCRRCIYKEALACIRLKKDKAEIIQKQMNLYKEKGYPSNNGLTENQVLFRKNSPTVIKVMERWWSELETQSRRDQLSLCYVCWDLGYAYKSYSKLEHRRYFHLSQHNIP